ncbi:hypothetical protein F2P81_017569 [Scophthalmus maximus]|uniref:Uncharacterized protein n=1 Tax=Scophthalmus maximus TaxID=52904 RepID=A0A6A4SF38_SCOMX|nr:hypothetical protein F2P81_017569 [Scophthalmus maximus]
MIDRVGAALTPAALQLSSCRRSSQSAVLTVAIKVSSSKHPVSDVAIDCDDLFEYHYHHHHHYHVTSDTSPKRSSSSHWIRDFSVIKYVE